VKHQRKGPNNTAKKTTMVDMRMRGVLGMIMLMEGGRLTVHNDCMKIELGGTELLSPSFILGGNAPQFIALIMH
jgi:hypothetical protein